jgi:hypothetical protein
MPKKKFAMPKTKFAMPKTSDVTYLPIQVLFSFRVRFFGNDFAKYNSATYEELQENNVLLEENRKLTKELLISRFDIYGDIPRFIFTADDDENLKQLTNAISSCNPLEMIEYVKQNAAVRDKHYSHRLIKMVPDETKFKLNYYLDFLSLLKWTHR